MRIIKELVQKVIVLLRLMVSQDSLKKYQKFFWKRLLLIFDVQLMVMKWKPIKWKQSLKWKLF